MIREAPFAWRSLGLLCDLCRNFTQTPSPVNHLLVIGAGRSATVLIDYLGSQAPQHGWTLTVADASLLLAQEKTRPYPAARAMALDVQDEPQRQAAVRAADVVVSLLPPPLHPLLATDCLTHGKHLLTASYVSPQMRALDAAAKAKGLLFLNEMGLDPGIDHLSAMRSIHQIRNGGGRITAFKSFCGGLMAPGSDANPWGYKFTWNPRNVVLAGQGTATFLEAGQLREVAYADLFGRTEPVQIAGYGTFEAYPNRDSLEYRGVYGLPDVRTMLRGTLRRPGYCAAWNVLVQLGLTDDATVVEMGEHETLGEFTARFLPGKGSLVEKLAARTGLRKEDPALEKVAWLGLEKDTPVGLTRATPAQVLQRVLEPKWQLQPEDRDLIVMQHQFTYERGGQTHFLTSSLAVEGESARTAMAKTVGLPLGIATKLLLQGHLPQRGVVIPVYPEIYEPVLAELAEHGIAFVDC
ncbi:MAG: saccharopine dehydrogenase NADP-binding domain-containing protein [Ferruginibacter sp.]|nr:saccharopine dehydrogenase NADP-binding domain-containing protein [Cytophagales bacterium]